MFCRKYSNILDALFIQCGCAAIASAAQESPTRFSKKQKQEGKKKISKKAFTSRPMNSRNFSSRGLFVSIPSFKFSTFETSGRRVVFIHRNHLEEEINPSLIILNI